jgi:hypothetical protein
VFCVIIIATEKKMTSKEKFCFVVMHGKTTELDSFFFFLTA